MTSINDLDTSRLSFDPKKDDFVETLEKASSAFQIDTKLSKRKILTYIAIAYDPNSELRKNIDHLPNRKLICALAAGFTLNKENKFSEEVESILSGNNVDVNRMIAEYCALSHGLDFAAYSFYARIFVEVMSMAHTNTKDMVPLVGKIRQEIGSLENKIFGGDEVAAMKRAIYVSSKQVSLKLQPEDIAEALANGSDLSEFNPYPSDYTPEKLRYDGEAIKQIQ